MLRRLKTSQSSWFVTELGDRVDQIAARQRGKGQEALAANERRRIQFREQMPCVAEVIDLFREVFGEDCKVLHAEEGGHKLAAVKRLRSLGLNEKGR